ncbi:hypothetical protein PG996_015775 [Apiospora saccharicola]|uniref:Uncharacterized protein n=1 Tax=Apiospora saccharicola TaxID=335842 RepID=A0ABR1TM25_9PEZI
MKSAEVLDPPTSKHAGKALRVGTRRCGGRTVVGGGRGHLRVLKRGRHLRRGRRLSTAWAQQLSGPRPRPK